MGMHWGKACFQALCAVLENTEAECLAVMLWCHLTGGDLHLGRAKGLLKALTSHSFLDALPPAVPLCRPAMDLFLAFSYQAACVVHILTTIVYLLVKGKGRCVCCGCLFLPLSFSLKLVACTTWSMWWASLASFYLGCRYVFCDPRLCEQYSQTPSHLRVSGYFQAVVTKQHLI